jgi:hypothetical protein
MEGIQIDWKVTDEKMKKAFLLPLLFLATAVAASLVYAAAQQPTQAGVRAIAGAAEALGGRERILAVKTIVLEGYGEAAYMNGGGNISASPDAPQKWVSIPEYEKTIDLEHRRMRVRQRNHQNFVFASAAGYLGAANPNTVYLDGEIAYNVGQNGRAVRGTEAVARSRRLDMFNNPCGDRSNCFGPIDETEQRSQSRKRAACRYRHCNGRQVDSGNR